MSSAKNKIEVSKFILNQLTSFACEPVPLSLTRRATQGLQGDRCPSASWWPTKCASSPTLYDRCVFSHVQAFSSTSRWSSWPTKTLLRSLPSLFHCAWPLRTCSTEFTKETQMPVWLLWAGITKSFVPGCKQTGLLGS